MDKKNNQIPVLYVTKNWTPFYTKGYKNWDIRNYQTDYRGKIYIVESSSNRIICQMDLVDCIPITKDLYEMNYHMHRILCSYDALPYIQDGKNAYIWVLKNDCVLDDKITIKRPNKRAFFFIEEIDFSTTRKHTPEDNNEEIFFKSIDNAMLFFWKQKSGVISFIAISYSLDPFFPYENMTVKFIYDDIEDEEKLRYIFEKFTLNIMQ